MNFGWLRNTCLEAPANFTLDISKKISRYCSWKNLLNNIDWLAVMLFGMNPCTLVPCAMCMAQLIWWSGTQWHRHIATSFQNFIPLKYNEIYLYERHFIAFDVGLLLFESCGRFRGYCSGCQAIAPSWPAGAFSLDLMCSVFLPRGLVSVLWHSFTTDTILASLCLLNTWDR